MRRSEPDGPVSSLALNRPLRAVWRIWRDIRRRAELISSTVREEKAPKHGRHRGGAAGRSGWVSRARSLAWPDGARAVVVYVVTVLMVRLGKKRFMGQSTAFDVILGIMLGSVVSRAITGNAPFFPALSAAAVLLAMHWLFSALAFRSHLFGEAIKGSRASSSGTARSTRRRCGART